MESTHGTGQDEMFVLLEEDGAARERGSVTDRSIDDLAQTYLAQLGDSLCSPSTPGEKDDAAAVTCLIVGFHRGKVCAAVAIDDVDDLVCEPLPALVRVRARGTRSDRQARIQHKDAVFGPRCQVSATNSHEPN